MINKKQRIDDIAADIVIVLVAIIVYFPVLAPGRVLLPTDLLLITPPWAEQSHQLSPGFTHVLRRTWDPLFQFYPSRKFLAESISKGWLPLWNPHAFSGTPFAADGQSAIFYPINWLFAVLPLGFAFGFVAFLHTTFTGLFFYLYGRRVGYSSAGSTAGAVVWMLCGVQTGWQMWQVVDSTLCWLPLCLYFWEGLRERGSSIQGVGLAVALGMTLLAGHLQFAFYVLLTTATYAVCRPIESQNAAFRTTVQNLIAWFSLAFAISSVQIAATADLLRLSIRTSAPISALLPSALSPFQFGLLVMPELFGGERDYLNHSFLAGEYYEKVIYCGASAIVFAFYALRLRRKNDLSRYWLGVIAFSLLMGFGTPLYAAFYYLVPLFKSFHGLSRVFVLFDFAIAALAAQGVTLFEREAVVDRKKTAQYAAGAVIFFIVLAYRFALLNNGQLVSYFLAHAWFSFGLEQLGIALGFAGAAFLILRFLPAKIVWIAPALLIADMLLFACGLNVGGQSNLLYPPTQETAFVSMHLAGAPLDRVLCIGDGQPDHAQSRITPNGAMSLDWNDVSGSDPLILARYNSFVRLINTADTGQPEPAGQGMIVQPGNPALDTLNVRWIVGRQNLDSPALQLACRGAVNVYENTGAKGPAWLVPLSHVTNTSDDSAGLQRNLLEANGPTVIDDGLSNPGIIPGRQPAPSVLQSPGVSSSGPGRLSVSTGAAIPALLVVSQTFSPGWVCNVDGRSSTIRIVNGLLTGVVLTAGSHVVDLRYFPSGTRLGLFISCNGWLAILCILFSGRTPFVRRTGKEAV